MTVDERRRAIASLLTSQGWVTVGQIAASFAISPMTARRDLAQLERDGALVRRHGGAVSAARSVRRTAPRQPATPSGVPAGVVRAAVAGLRADEALFLDHSPLAHAVAREIAARGVRCAVLTNSLGVMASVQRELRAQAPTTLICIGGRLDRRIDAFVGAVAVAQIRRHYAAVAVLGEPSADPAAEEVRHAMAAQAGRVVAVHGRRPAPAP